MVECRRQSSGNESGRSRRQSENQRKKDRCRRRGLAAACFCLCLLCLAGVLTFGRVSSSHPIPDAVVKQASGTEPEKIQQSQKSSEEVYLNDTASGTGSQEENPAVSGEGKEPEIGQMDSALTMANGFSDTEDQVVIRENGVNLREESQTESRIIAQLSAGQVLERTGKSEEWSRVLYEGATCYVSTQLVDVQEKTESDQVDQTKEQSGSDSDEQPQDMDQEAMVRAASEGGAQPISNGRVIVIDAGHQGKENSGKEPVGPDSSSMKQKMTKGAVGSHLGIQECDVTLAIAKKTKEILSQRGYQVILTRESNDVNLSNVERARLANRSEADAFIHIHAHNQDSASVTGVLAVCQSSNNPYNSALTDKSYALSRNISTSVRKASGAKNRGVKQTDTLSEINWSQVPVTVLEVGFLSNQQEELLLSQEEYQQLIASGIADGLDQYFASGY